MESYGMLVFLSFAFVQGYSITSTNTSSVLKQGDRRDVLSPEVFLQRLHGLYMEYYPDLPLESFLKFIEYTESNLKRYEQFVDGQIRLAQKVQTFFEKNNKTEIIDRVNARCRITEIRQSKMGAPMVNTLMGNILGDTKDLISSQDYRDTAPRPTGIRYITVGSMPPFKVLCNMEVDNGNWTVIQQRLDGSVDFRRTWKEYKDGFGTIGKDFWLGNDKIHALTTSHHYELRVDISDWEGKSWYAIYDKFRVEDETLKYKLTIGSYSGTAGDSLSWYNGMFFSTLDNDNDNHSTGNCAKINGGGGGWWYKSCGTANLNGLYPEGSGFKGIEWTKARSGYSMKYSRMMIRRK